MVENDGGGRSVNTRDLLRRLIKEPFDHITVNTANFGVSKHSEFAGRTYFSDRVNDRSKFKHPFTVGIEKRLEGVYKAGLGEKSVFDSINASFAFAEIASELGLPTEGIRFSLDDSPDERAQKTAKIIQELTFIARFARDSDAIDPRELSQSYLEAFPAGDDAAEPGEPDMTWDELASELPEKTRVLIADIALGVNLGWRLAGLGLIWGLDSDEVTDEEAVLQAEIRCAVMDDGLMNLWADSFEEYRRMLLAHYAERAPNKHVSTLAGMASRYAYESLSGIGAAWRGELIDLAKECCLEMPPDIVDGVEVFGRIVERVESGGPDDEWRTQQHTAELLGRFLHEELTPAESNARLAELLAGSMVNVIDGTDAARSAIASAYELVARYDVSIHGDADDVREVSKLAERYRDALESTSPLFDDWHDQADAVELDLAQLAFAIEERYRGSRREDRSDCLDMRLVTLYRRSHRDVREAILAALLLDPQMPDVERRFALGRSMEAMKAIYAFEPIGELRRAIRDGYERCLGKLIDPDEWSDF